MVTPRKVMLGNRGGTEAPRGLGTGHRRPWGLSHSNGEASLGDEREGHMAGALRRLNSHPPEKEVYKRCLKWTNQEIILQ